MSKGKAPAVPEPVHARQEGTSADPQWRDQDDDPELEATQLHALPSASYSQASTHDEVRRSDADGTQPLVRRRSSIVRAAQKVQHSRLGAFWRRQVYLSVPHEKCRDHLGQFETLRRKEVSHLPSQPFLTVSIIACERTFLAYFRTASWLAMIGVMVAQLFRLNDDLQRGSFGFYRASRGLAAMLVGSTIVIVLVGAIRFWRQQTAMARGKVWAAGWELNLTGFLYGAVSCMTAVHSIEPR